MNQLIQHLRIEAKLQMWTTFCTSSQVLCLTEQEILYKSANINPGNHIFISCIKEGRISFGVALKDWSRYQLSEPDTFATNIYRQNSKDPQNSPLTVSDGDHSTDQRPASIIWRFVWGLQIQSIQFQQILDTGTSGNLGPWGHREYFRSQENTRYLHLVHYYCIEDGRPDEAGGCRQKVWWLLWWVMNVQLVSDRWWWALTPPGAIINISTRQTAASSPMFLFLPCL